MLTNEGHLSYDQMVEIILLPMTVHINEYYMANMLSFIEVANIAGVHINIDTSKEKSINVHIQARRIIHSKARAEVILYTNLDYPSMFTKHINTSVKPYYLISTVKKI